MLRSNRRPRNGRSNVRLALEILEDRCLLSGSVVQANLVSDGSVTANHIDPNLVNPWGVAFQPGGPFWASDNGTGKSDFFDSTGVAAGATVTIPLPSNTTTGHSHPTGIVYNGTNDFLLTNAAGSSATFIFATEDGTISGWNAVVNGVNAILKVDNPSFGTGGPVYKGLAIGNNGTANFLYAANFAAGTIDVFDKNYAKTTLAGSFTDTDPNLAGYAPFNIQAIGNQLYVTYAKQDPTDPTHHKSVFGAGNGFVDIFDMNGNFVKRLISNGALNAPWGITIAPSTFAPFPNALLVGNFGDGTIHAFDAATGTLLGQVVNNANQPIVASGLWALVFGNGGAGGNSNTLYIDAGPNHGTNGFFASLTPTDPTQSTVALTSATVTSGSSTTVTLTVRDANGIQETVGGATVAFQLGTGNAAGTFGVVTDNGNGTYSATFTGTTAGTVKITATINGQAVTTVAPTMMVNPGAATLAQSLVSPSPLNVPAGGTATVTLTAKDTNGNQETGGGLMVGFVLGTGTATGGFSAVTDNHNGTYTALFTAGTSLGTGTITATIGGQTVTSTATLNVTAAAVSLANSIVTVQPTTVQVGSTATVKLTAKDTLGNQEGAGGLSVAFVLGTGTATGTFSTVTDNNDGTYTATFTAGTLAGTLAINATIGGQNVTSTAPVVTETPGAVSLAQSTVVIAPTNVAAGGTATVTLTAMDQNGNQETGGGLTVAFNLGAGVGAGTFSNLVDHANGTYTATFTGTTAGSVAITATIGGQQVTSKSPTITVIVFGPSGTITTDVPTFGWKIVTGADHYDLWIDNLTTGQSPVLLLHNIMTNSVTLSAAQALSPGHSYRWWVRGLTIIGTPFPWSAPADIMITPLGVPTLSGASGNLATDQTTYNWTTVALAAKYDVWLTDLTLGGGGGIIASPAAATLASGSLSPGHHYRWWVRAKSLDNTPGAWSLPTDFVVPAMTAPTLTSPVGAQATDQLTFTWSSVALAAKYDVWLTDMTTGMQGIIASPTGTSLPSGSLSPGHTYRWWVRAVSTNGTPGAWSMPSDFVLAALAVPTLTGPSGLQASYQPTFSWTAVNLAVKYDVWLTDLNGTINGIIASPTTTTLLDPSMLMGGHTYRWWVRAVSANGTPGAWSLFTDFTAPGGLPGYP